MLRHFGNLLNSERLWKGKKEWDWEVFHIRCATLFFFALNFYRSKISIHRCLAHIINLATQAFIAAYSQTKHFDPASPNDHEPDIGAFVRDEVGLIRAIAVKVCEIEHYSLLSSMSKLGHYY